MPQFDTTFFQSQVFWTIISFAVLFVVLKKWVLPAITEILNQRAQLISKGMSDIEQMRSEAEVIKAEYAKQLAEVDEQTSVMIKTAEKQISARRALGLSELQGEIQRRKAQFLDDERVLRDQSIKEVRKQSAQLVIAATEQVIQQKLNESEAQKMLNQVIDELDIHRDLKKGE